MMGSIRTEIGMPALVKSWAALKRWVGEGANGSMILARLSRKPDGGERKIVFIINCAENEAKKIVGKAGLTIMALRRLASGTAKKLNIPFPVEVEVFDELLGD